LVIRLLTWIQSTIFTGFLVSIEVAIDVQEENSVKVQTLWTVFLVLIIIMVWWPYFITKYFISSIGPNSFFHLWSIFIWFWHYTLISLLL